MFEVCNVGREVVVAVAKFIEVENADAFFSNWADLDVGLVVQVVEVKQLGEEAAKAAKDSLLGEFYVKNESNGYF